MSYVLLNIIWGEKHFCNAFFDLKMNHVTIDENSVDIAGIFFFLVLLLLLLRILRVNLKILTWPSRDLYSLFFKYHSKYFPVTAHGFFKIYLRIRLFLKITVEFTEDASYHNLSSVPKPIFSKTFYIVLKNDDKHSKYYIYYVR